MRIVVNHLTRMQPGYICVAGIDLQSGHHVRPVLAGGRLDTSLLAKAGGLFDIGAVVDLGATRPHGHPPETEDHLFTPAAASVIGELTPTRFWNRLKDSSAPDFRAIFGSDLRAYGTSAVVNVNAGETSLGCLRLETPPSIEINSWDKIRAHVTDGEFDLDLSVTDLRLYREDHQTPRRKLVSEIEKRIGKGVPVILAVGLTRPFRKRGDVRSYHWLQVNNIHLKDDPIWKLA